MSDLTTKAAEIRAGLVERLRDDRHCNDWYLRQEAAALIEQQAAELNMERRRHQNTRDSRGRWKVSTFKEQRRATTAESERDKALAELDRLRKLCTHDDDDICQTLGKALGYPWYKDDQSNFPGATEENGVCVGEHVAASIAAEAAKRLDALAAERDELLREKERLGAAPDLYEALKGLVQEFGDRGGPNDELFPPEHQVSEIAAAMRAIAKAEGR